MGFVGSTIEKLQAFEQKTCGKTFQSRWLNLSFHLNAVTVKMDTQHTYLSGKQRFAQL